MQLMTLLLISIALLLYCHSRGSHEQRKQEAMSIDEFKQRYSGPNRSGICVCGHSWEKHHLGVVTNPEYTKQTGESYVPGECNAFAFNEAGGLMLVKGKWVDHCHTYRDNKETQDEPCPNTGGGNHGSRARGQEAFQAADTPARFVGAIEGLAVEEK
jgi:hypothetical protein